MVAVTLTVLTRIESIIATMAYTIVALLLMVDVIGRELFATAFLGLQQIAVYAAIVAGFLGLTLATSDNAHLRPTFMDRLFTDQTGVVVDRISDVVAAVVFISACYIGWTFVDVSMQSRDKAPVLYFVLWPLQLILPYAFASAAVKHLIFALRPALKRAPSGATR